MARVVYCRCAYAQVVPREVKDATLDALVASGVDFEAVPDLCEMSARRDPRLIELARTPGLRVAACYPRAVRWLFSAAGAPLPAEGVRIQNMRVDTAEQVVAAVLSEAAEPEARHE